MFFFFFSEALGQHKFLNEQEGGGARTLCTQEAGEMGTDSGGPVFGEHRLFWSGKGESPLDL